MRTMLMLTGAVALLGCNGQMLTGQTCTSSSDCDDGLYCNGVERCLSNQCLTGVAPDCSDAIACTVDSCSENERRCVSKVPDTDSDGFGDIACLDAAGVPLGNDCDDRNGRRFPGNVEVCNTTDEDCDLTTLGDVDADEDGYESNACSNPLADAGVKRGTDCNDTNPATHPGQIEVCNGLDDNCSGAADEGVQVTIFKDDDNDGWGAGTGVLGCPSAFTSALGTDCNDGNPMIHPGSISCVATAPGQYAMCNQDGGIDTGFCSGQTCRAQPNGTGVCL